MNGVEKLAQIDAAAVAEARSDAKPIILDVRAPDEWSKGHLPDALHIPLAALPDRIAEIDGDRPVVVHCKGGGRSAIATSFLQRAGLRDVANMKGGYESWVAGGFPTVNESAETNTRK
jgi:hydroxyacylglutathione hydrolase